MNINPILDSYHAVLFNKKLEFIGVVYDAWTNLEDSIRSVLNNSEKAFKNIRVGILIQEGTVPQLEHAETFFKKPLKRNLLKHILIFVLDADQEGAIHFNMNFIIIFRCIFS